MKIVTPKQMTYLESQAYRNGSSEEEFMEEAGRGIAEWVVYYIEKENLPERVYLLCGQGNNGGDAYTAGCYLLKDGFEVIAYDIGPADHTSPLCQRNRDRFFSLGGQYYAPNDVEETLKFDQEGVILDGLFGTGFHGTAREPYATAIRLANASGLPILAIDIPSGLNGETGVVEGEAIRARETIFLGLPKLGFFLQDGWNHVGKLRYVNFGLPLPYIEECDADLQLIYPPAVKAYLPRIVNNRHKYQAGFVIGLGGSPGMPGASLLSSLAALRAGAGIVKLLHPAGMEAELAASALEIIKIPYRSSETEKILEWMNQASAVFIGPGIGREPETGQLLKNLLPRINTPCILDADALTLIAAERIHCPPHAILTPHIGEMMRLLNKSVPHPHTKEFLTICQEYADAHQVSLVLKGGPTFIFHPHAPIRVNPYGDPGMATAGSGDILTGILAGLAAQHIPLEHAADLGVYLHGYAGEQAAAFKTSYSMIASDILEELPTAFASLL